MKFSAYTFFVVVALLSEVHSASMLAAAGKLEDTSSELDTSSVLFLNEDAADNTFSPATSSSYPDAPNREGSSRIIIVADSGLWRSPKMAVRGLPLLRRWNLGAEAVPRNVLTVERRDTNEDVVSKVPIGRRDAMRCMVGRVYRPCWEDLVRYLPWPRQFVGSSGAQPERRGRGLAERRG
ncbi:pro-MCH [Arapaima gigas]